MIETKELGILTAKTLFPRKSRKEKPDEVGRSKKWRAIRRKFRKDNKTVNLAPVAKDPKTILRSGSLVVTEDDQWQKVKFDSDTFQAVEMVVLVRHTPDGPMKLFLTDMFNVKAFIDSHGALLVRPYTTPSQPNGTPTLVPAPEPSRDLHDAPHKSRKPRANPVVLGGRHGLNPAKEGTKRYFLIESIFDGGTAQEIVKRADKFARRGGIPKGDLIKTILATTSNIKEVAEYVVSKCAELDIHLKVRERDGVITLRQVKK